MLDEEQRFGVEDKEKLKVIKTGVDVLTMSATPIPRTLHMALTGMRDISTIGHAAQGAALRWSLIVHGRSPTR